MSYHIIILYLAAVELPNTLPLDPNVDPKAGTGAAPNAGPDPNPAKMYN